MKVSYVIPFENFDKQKNCELEKMYVHPDFQGSGIGKIALNQLIELLGNREMKIFYLCVLNTNHNGIKFYKTMGFKFHRKLRLNYTYFKEELKGLVGMYLKLSV